MMTVLNCNPTGIHRAGDRSTLTDFATPEENDAFIEALQSARLAVTNPKASSERVRKMLGYDEFATQSVE